jgi:hypothetical protein
MTTPDSNPDYFKKNRRKGQMTTQMRKQMTIVLGFVILCCHLGCYLALSFELIFIDKNIFCEI